MFRGDTNHGDRGHEPRRHEPRLESNFLKRILHLHSYEVIHPITSFHFHTFHLYK